MRRSRAASAWALATARRRLIWLFVRTVIAPQKGGPPIHNAGGAAGNPLRQADGVLPGRGKPGCGGRWNSTAAPFPRITAGLEMTGQNHSSGVSRAASRHTKGAFGVARQSLRTAKHCDSVDVHGSAVRRHLRLVEEVAADGSINPDEARLLLASMSQLRESFAPLPTEASVIHNGLRLVAALVTTLEITPWIARMAREVEEDEQALLGRAA